MKKRWIGTLALAGWLIVGGAAAGETLQIAVAANFKPTMMQLAQRYRQLHPEVTLRVSSGSTGKLARQIRYGAPYDLFFAADRRHVQALMQRKMLCAARTYAVGRLALYQRTGDARPLTRLKRLAFRHLAIASPKTAPYGLAAKTVLRKLGLWETVQPRLVRGENVGQAFQYVHSGNAELGFVALSLAKMAQGGEASERVWIVPEDWHAPLIQQAGVVCRSGRQAAARDFLRFVLQDERARETIARAGYALPKAARSEPAGTVSDSTP